MKKSVVIVPVFNEEAHVADVLCELRRWHSQEILVINDGSTDRSAEILGALKCAELTVITHGTNKGYGASLIEGFRFAKEERFDQIVTMDADWQHQPCAVPKLLAALDEGWDIVSGSRYLKEGCSNDPAPPERMAINREITARINELTGYSLTDAFCGFKSLRVEAIARLDLHELGYAFPLEFWIQAAAAKLKVREFPVRRIYNDPNRTFGVTLNDPTIRLAHYHSIINREAEKWLHVR